MMGFVEAVIERCLNYDRASLGGVSNLSLPSFTRYNSYCCITFFALLALLPLSFSVASKPIICDIQILRQKGMVLVLLFVHRCC